MKTSICILYMVPVLTVAALSDHQTATNYSSVAKYGPTADGIFSSIAEGKFKGMSLASQIQWFKNSVDINSCGCVGLDSTCEFSLPLTILRKFGVDCSTQFCCKRKKKATEESAKDKSKKCKCELPLKCAEKFIDSSNKSSCPIGTVHCCRTSGVVGVKNEQDTSIVHVVMPVSQQTKELHNDDDDENTTTPTTTEKEDDIPTTEEQVPYIQEVFTPQPTSELIKKVCHCVSRSECSHIDETIINKKGYECPFNLIQCCQKESLENNVLIAQRKPFVPVWVPKPVIPSSTEESSIETTLVLQREAPITVTTTANPTTTTTSSTTRSSTTSETHTQPETTTILASERSDVLPHSNDGLAVQSREQSPDYRLLASWYQQNRVPIPWLLPRQPNYVVRGQEATSNTRTQQETLIDRIMKFFG